MFWQVLFLLVILIPLVAIVLDSQVGKALARRLEGAEADRLEQRLGERIRYLEGEVERLTGEVERLNDESDFLHELLAQRPPPDERGRRALEAGENDD
jgi:cell division protein FtsB